MPRPATKIILSHDERQQLTGMLRRPKAQARYAERARIILRAGEGVASSEIARQLRIGKATVSKWRTRFEREGLDGLHDDHRPGRPPQMDEEEFRTRLLQQLDTPPPAGHARWDGTLLAKELAVSADRRNHAGWLGFLGDFRHYIFDDFRAARDLKAKMGQKL